MWRVPVFGACEGCSCFDGGADVPGPLRLIESSGVGRLRNEGEDSVVRVGRGADNGLTVVDFSTKSNTSRSWVGCTGDIGIHYSGWLVEESFVNMGARLWDDNDSGKSGDESVEGESTCLHGGKEISALLRVGMGEANESE